MMLDGSTHKIKKKVWRYNVRMEFKCTFIPSKFLGGKNKIESFCALHAYTHKEKTEIFFAAYDHRFLSFPSPLVETYVFIPIAHPGKNDENFSIL